MTTSQELSLKRYEAKSAHSEILVREAVEVLKNPVVEFVAAMVAIAILEEIEIKKNSGNHILEGPEALAARAFITAVILCQQIGPQGMSELIKGVAGPINAGSGALLSALPALMAA